MAQWRVMNAYDLETTLPSAPSPHAPITGPLPAEEGFAANSLEAPNVGAVLGGMVRTQFVTDSTLNGNRLSASSSVRDLLLYKFDCGMARCLRAMLTELAASIAAKAPAIQSQRAV